jgi:hypothetical protein
VGTCVNVKVTFVALMERSAIRERWFGCTAAPDCASLHPGYDGRMVLYRRNFVPGGTFFFTAALADRRTEALIENIELLRHACRVTCQAPLFDQRRRRASRSFAHHHDLAHRRRRLSGALEALQKSVQSSCCEAQRRRIEKPTRRICAVATPLLGAHHPSVTRWISNGMSITSTSIR